MALRYLALIEKGKSTYGHLDGYLYTCTDTKNDRKYWKCRKKTECSARLVTVAAGHNVVIRKGGDPASHSHAPNPEEVEALRLMGTVKRAAADHPERPPSAVMRIVREANEGVQAHLPTEESIRKSIRRERLKELPANPTSIDELRKLPEQYRKTVVGENFLLYDSYEDDDWDDDRIVVFATRANVKLLFKSEVWYVDGTFQVVPSIFFQLFSIMGSVPQIYKGTERKIAVPLVHALLENKCERSYAKVFEVLLEYAQEHGIVVIHPQKIMSDFELGIINALEAHFPNDSVSLCLFHLCQSVFRKIQSEGLQQQYRDQQDSSIRDTARSMCALAFVPPGDVPEIFDMLYITKCQKIFYL